MTGRRGTRHAAEVVEVTIPPKPEFLTVARLTAATVAARQSFTYDEIEDLKIAVSEACTALLLAGTAGHPLALRFALDGDTLEVRIVTKGPGISLGAAGLRTEAYASGRAFLAAYDPSRPGCLVLDLRLRGEYGLDVQDELHHRKAALPIIVLTAHGTVPASVRALKAGAIEFLRKPTPPATLLARIRDALAMDESARRQTAMSAARERRIARLTTRERQVLNLLLGGKTSKQIATGLGLSVRTVEGYRARIYLKTDVSSVAQLVRVVLAQE